MRIGLTLDLLDDFFRSFFVRTDFDDVVPDIISITVVKKCEDDEQLDLFHIRKFLYFFFRRSSPAFDEPKFVCLFESLLEADDSAIVEVKTVAVSWLESLYPENPSCDFFELLFEHFSPYWLETF